MVSPTTAACPQRRSARGSLGWLFAGLLIGAPCTALASPCMTPGQPSAAPISLQDPVIAGTLLTQLGIWTEMLKARDTGKI